MKKAIYILGILACIPILAYLFLLGASHVYVSGGLGGQMFEDTDDNPVWESIASLNLPGLRDPGPIVVEQVHAVHAIRNAVFIFCTAGLLALFPLLCFVSGILYTVYGLFAGDWNAFLSGLLLTVIGTPFITIMVVLGLLLFWLGLLFMPCTPAYAVLWLPLGSLFGVFGAIGGSSPTAVLILTIESGS